jgi:ABC-2 type transport system permease protein
LSWIADALPLECAYDALASVAGGGEYRARLTADVAVPVGAAPLALALGPATLRRRTA